MTMRQYVYENVLSGHQNDMFYNHNVDTEAFHQYIFENGLLGYQNDSLYNHNVGTEACPLYVSTYGNSSWIYY